MNTKGKNAGSARSNSQGRIDPSSATPANYSFTKQLVQANQDGQWTRYWRAKSRGHANDASKDYPRYNNTSNRLQKTLKYLLYLQEDAKKQHARTKYVKEPTF